MTTIDLIMLGLLYQRPHSPYEMQKRMDERNLSRWIRIGANTVYKKVQQYEAKGYVTSEIVKGGNLPDKTVYTITKQGKEKFHTLMKEISNFQTRVFLDFNAVIVNLPLLDTNGIFECLHNIKVSIQNTKMQISEQIPTHQNIPLVGKSILEQQLMLLETLESWESNLEEQILKEHEEV